MNLPGMDPYVSAVADARALANDKPSTTSYDDGRGFDQLMNARAYWLGAAAEAIAELGAIDTEYARRRADR